LPIGFFSWAKNNIKNFDVVYCHDFFTLQNITIAHFCKKYSVPFIVQPHGTLSTVRQKSKAYLLKKIFLEIFSNVLKNSKHIVALTENEKREITTIDKTLKNKIVVIPNGLNLEEFENVQKINLHDKFSIPKENKIIGYIGRVHRIKGIDISLEILAKLKEIINFTYLIIGPDEGEKEKLEKSVKELGLKNNVIFTGILEGHGKLETIKSCDLFLFTSRSEGLPMTILEIAALGVPQIISKNCNVPEIEKYGAGFEFSLEDKNKMTEKIQDFFINKNNIENLGGNATRMAKNHFDIIKISKKIENILF
jgi:glycosyltransferase involved in cell wall biosynthesis